LSGGAEEKHENSQSGQLMFQQIWTSHLPNTHRRLEDYH
jgi:hypothetical protein